MVARLFVFIFFFALSISIAAAVTASGGDTEDITHDSQRDFPNHRNLHKQRRHNDVFGYGRSFCGSYGTSTECDGADGCMWCHSQGDSGGVGEGYCVPGSASTDGRRLKGRGRGSRHGHGNCCKAAEDVDACNANSATNVNNGGEECVWLTTETTVSRITSASVNLVIPDRSGCKEVTCGMIGPTDDDGCTYARGCMIGTDSDGNPECDRLDCDEFEDETACNVAISAGAACQWSGSDDYWWRAGCRKVRINS